MFSSPLKPILDVTHGWMKVGCTDRQSRVTAGSLFVLDAIVNYTCLFSPGGWNEFSSRVSVKKRVWSEAAIVRACVGGFQGFPLPWNRSRLKCSGRVEQRLKSGHAGDEWRWVKGALPEHGGPTLPPSPPPSRRTLIWRVISVDSQAKSLVEERSELLVCYFAPDGRQVNVTVAWITRNTTGAEGEPTPTQTPIHALLVFNGAAVY